MASNKNEYLVILGERLAEERKRCEHTQKTVAVHFDISTRTQIKYELGETAPDAYYLHGIGEIGLDVAYVLTGKRSTSHVSDDEDALLAAYRRLGEEIRPALLALAASMARRADQQSR